MNRVGLVAFALVGVACGDKETTAPQEVARDNSEAATLAAEAPLVEPTATSLPIPEDFEAEMIEAVTPENYRAQFDAVLAELNAS